MSVCFSLCVCACADTNNFFPLLEMKLMAFLMVGKCWTIEPYPRPSVCILD